MWIAIALILLVATVNAIAAAGAPMQAAADGHGDAPVGWAQLVYLLAAATALAAAVARFWPSETLAFWLFVAAAVFSSSAPLLYGVLTGQFTLSHHLVRAALLVVIVIAVRRL